MKRFLTVTPAEAQQLRRLLNSRVSVSGGLEATKTPDGVSLRLKRSIGAGAGGAGVRLFVFKNHTSDGDGLICRSWDGETEGSEDIIVAKPFLLRRTPFDGQTYNGVDYDYINAARRTATKDGEPETQVVTMDYVVDDPIYAIVSPFTGVEDDEERPIRLLDLNIDARAWAQEIES